MLKNLRLFEQSGRSPCVATVATRTCCLNSPSLVDPPQVQPFPHTDSSSHIGNYSRPPALPCVTPAFVGPSRSARGRTSPSEGGSTTVQLLGRFWCHLVGNIRWIPDEKNHLVHFSMAVGLPSIFARPGTHTVLPRALSLSVCVQ